MNHYPVNKVKLMDISSNSDEISLLKRRITELELTEIELKSAAMALNENQRILSTLMNNLPGMTYRRLNDDNMTMQFISSGSYQLTGFQPDQLVNSKTVSYARLISDEDLPNLKSLISKSLMKDNKFQAFYRITDAQGNEKWVWEHGHGVYSSLRKLIAIEGFIIDVTEYKQSEENLKKSRDCFNKAMVDIIQAMSIALELRDPYTAGHNERIAQLGFAIAHEIGLSTDQAEVVKLAGIAHDIGKIYIPVEILSKPGRLNDVEMKLIRLHSLAGYEIIKGVAFPWPIASIVVQHHERINGSGYPYSLTGNNILLEAKIIAVADVVEAMASPRPYRAALGIEKALDEIVKNRGVLYDTDVADSCIRVFKKGNFLFEYNTHKLKIMPDRIW